MSEAPKNDSRHRSKTEPHERREKQLGDEHRYGFEEDPAADDKVDNRMVVRTKDEDGNIHTSQTQQSAPATAKKPH